MEKEEIDPISKYLITQHDRLLHHIEFVDNKIAQCLAINCLILSFIFDKFSDAQSPKIFIGGLVFIVLSLIIGILLYLTKKVLDSPNTAFYQQKQDFESLKKYLLNDMDNNTEVLFIKSKFFNLMLAFVTLGIIMVIWGYYGI